MKRRFFYRQNGEIVAYTNGGYVGCGLPSVLLDTTPAQELAISKNYDLSIEGNALKIVVPPHKQKEEDKEQFLASAKDGKITLQDIVDYLMKQ